MGDQLDLFPSLPPTQRCVSTPAPCAEEPTVPCPPELLATLDASLGPIHLRAQLVPLVHCPDEYLVLEVVSPLTREARG